jgi:hypothetical protein
MIPPTTTKGIGAEEVKGLGAGLGAGVGDGFGIGVGVGPGSALGAARIVIVSR